MEPEHREPAVARRRYQRRAAVAAMLGISDDLLAKEMKRHPAGIPEPDADAEGANGKVEPLWLPRLTEWQAWRASFPGRTGRPSKMHASD
jgi:hypothetical protein